MYKFILSLVILSFAQVQAQTIPCDTLLLASEQTIIVYIIAESDHEVKFKPCGDTTEHYYTISRDKIISIVYAYGIKPASTPIMKRPKINISSENLLGGKNGIYVVFPLLTDISFGYQRAISNHLVLGLGYSKTNRELLIPYEFFENNGAIRFNKPGRHFEFSSKWYWGKSKFNGGYSLINFNYLRNQRKFYIEPTPPAAYTNHFIYGQLGAGYTVKMGRYFLDANGGFNSPLLKLNPRYKRRYDSQFPLFFRMSVGFFF